MSFNMSMYSFRTPNLDSLIPKPWQLFSPLSAWDLHGLIESPKGSKDPNNRVSGPKYHEYCSIWALKPQYLGPWTLMGHCVQCTGRQEQNSPDRCSRQKLTEAVQLIP